MANKVNKIKKTNSVTKVNQPTRSEFEQLAEASNDAVRIVNKNLPSVMQ
jgi:hypothetical protein